MFRVDVFKDRCVRHVFDLHLTSLSSKSIYGLVMSVAVLSHK